MNIVTRTLAEALREKLGHSSDALREFCAEMSIACETYEDLADLVLSDTSPLRLRFDDDVRAAVESTLTYLRKHHQLTLT